MEDWQKSISESITNLKELAELYPVDPELLRPVIDRYPMRITRYYLNLIQKVGDPIWRQCIPDILELKDSSIPTDPLCEGEFSPLPGIIHRYPDRIVLIVSSYCPTFCRFCTRKNLLSEKSFFKTYNNIESPINYIKETTSIRDVILSGGDPLMLMDDELEEILVNLRNISHIEIIRINTRIPVTLPERVTPKLCQILKRFHPLYINTHFNHPLEITPQSSNACSMLADSGIPLGNQTVLLKDVNDNLEVMKELMQKLLTIRVKPYYLHHMDLVRGTSHFRTSVDTGLKIMAGLRGYTSGIAVPYYVIDLPGGKGKVSILPDDVKREGKILYLRNYLGEVVKYKDE